MRTLDCTIVGDVFIDVIVQLADEQLPLIRGGTSYCSSVNIALGGAGNVAVGLSAIGGKAAFVGKAGCDAFGKLYKSDLRKNRVATDLLVDKSFPTGMVVAFVQKNEERSFLVFRGANDNLSREETRGAGKFLRRSKYLFFSGYSLVNNPQQSAILEAVELAKKFDTKIIFDPGAFNLVVSFKRLFKELSEQCDVFSPNLDEARAITNTNDLDDIVEKLRERIPLTFLKSDKNGCIVINKKQVVRMPGYDVKCVDPTGAGDAFAAGMIYGLSRGLPLKSVGKLANWFAARTVCGIGARSFPERYETKRFLKKTTIDRNDCKKSTQIQKLRREGS